MGLMVFMELRVFVGFDGLRGFQLAVAGKRQLKRGEDLGLWLLFRRLM